MSGTKKAIKPERARRQFWYVVRQGLIFLVGGFILSFLIMLAIGLGSR